MTTVHRGVLALFFSLILTLLLLAAALPASAQGGPTPTPRPLYALPDPNTVRVSQGGAIVLAANQRYLITANTFTGTASVVDIYPRTVVAEIPVGEEPRSLVVSPDQTWFAVTDFGGGTVSLVDLSTFDVLAVIPVGERPWGVVTSGARLYVALSGQDAVAEVDVSAREVVRLISVPPKPAGLVLWGDFLYMTHFDTGALTLVYLPTGVVAGTTRGTQDANLSPALWLDPFDGMAYLPATRANAANPALTFDSTAWPVVNVFPLRDLTSSRARRIALDVADRPVNLPWDATLDRARRWLWVVNAGSNDVSVIDLATGFARAHIPVGANPRGITRFADGSTLFVYNALDGTVSVIEAASLEVTDMIQATHLDMPVDLLIGAQLFYGSVDGRLSEDRRLSCATCHFDGGSDGRRWEGLPGGPCRTPDLRELDGEIDPLWLDAHIRTVQHGSGLLDASGGPSPDLDALIAYLRTLPTE